MGKGFQKFQKVPLFTAEHVKGVQQDSKLDTSLIRQDLGFEPTPLAEALQYSLSVIDKNWDLYLKPREEKTITVD
jgi:nucleoside-diphosphate-sugar epimerase